MLWIDWQCARGELVRNMYTTAQEQMFDRWSGERKPQLAEACDDKWGITERWSKQPRELC